MQAKICTLSRGVLRGPPYTVGRDFDTLIEEFAADPDSRHCQVHGGRRQSTEWNHCTGVTASHPRSSATPSGCTIGSRSAFAMSRTFSPSVASRFPTKPFDLGAGSLDRSMPELCGGDKVGSVISGTWMSCSSRCAASGTIFGEPWTRMVMSSISWSHAGETREPPCASFARF